MRRKTEAPLVGTVMGLTAEALWRLGSDCTCSSKMKMADTWVKRMPSKECERITTEH